MTILSDYTRYLNYLAMVNKKLGHREVMSYPTDSGFSYWLAIQKEIKWQKHHFGILELAQRISTAAENRDTIIPLKNCIYDTIVTWEGEKPTRADIMFIPSLKGYIQVNGFGELIKEIRLKSAQRLAVQNGYADLTKWLELYFEIKDKEKA